MTLRPFAREEFDQLNLLAQEVAKHVLLQYQIRTMDRDDLANEILTAMWKYRDSYDPEKNPGGVSAYMMRIGTNIVLKQTRKKRVKGHELSENIPSAEKPTEETSSVEILREHLRQLLKERKNRLTPRQIQTIEMILGGRHQQMREIYAELFGPNTEEMKKTTLKMRINRHFQKVRKALGITPTPKTKQRRPRKQG